MARDKSYGSGYKNTGMSKATALKPGRLKKTAPAVAKAKVIKSIVSKSKGAGTAFDIGGRQYMETGVSPAKLVSVAKALFNAGKFSMAEAVEARVAAKTIGRNVPKEYSYFSKGSASGPGTVEGKLRAASESVFPRGTDLAKRALKAKSEQRTAIRESMNYQFPFNRVINESERIERKYGLTQRTAEEGIKQAAKRIKPRKTGGR